MKTALSSFDLRALVAEWQDLVGGHVDKAYQRGDEVILRINAPVARPNCSTRPAVGSASTRSRRSQRPRPPSHKRYDGSSTTRACEESSNEGLTALPCSISNAAGNRTTSFSRCLAKAILSS